MKRTVLLIILSALLTQASYAQYSNMKFSESSAELTGNLRVKILKNGNTGVVNFTKSDGIHVTLYDTNRKKISDEKLNLKNIKFDLKFYRIRCIQEINNDIMIMFEGMAPVPILYRILVDGSTGKLKKEEEAARVNVSEGKKSSLVFSDRIPTPTFFVAKDPNSDYYAIVVYNVDATEANRRIEVVHYSPAHIQINRAFFLSPKGQYKFLNYSDVYVCGENYIILSAYVYNMESIKNNTIDECEFYLSKLSKGNTSFKDVELPYTKTTPQPSYALSSFFSLGSCKFALDKASNTLYAVADTYSHFDKVNRLYVYDFHIQPFNPDNMEMRKPFKVTPEKTNLYYQTNINPNSIYTGMPQSFMIDRTTGHLIFLNEMYVTHFDQKISTELSDPAIIDVSADGKENYTMIIPYHHWTWVSEPFFNYLHNKTGCLYHTTEDEFNSTYVDQIPGKKYNYVFLNNTLANYGKVDNATDFEKRVKPGMSGFSSIIYRIDKKGNMSKELLFGKSVNKDDSKYCLFNSADFNPETNTYAVVVQNAKSTSVLWMILE